MSEESLLQECLTCRRKTETFLRILNDDGGETSVKFILAKHFWFEAVQYWNRVLCTSCWTKIYEFHKFYREVEDRWVGEELILDVEVKRERLEEEELPASGEAVKAERLELNEENFGKDLCEDFEPDEIKAELVDKTSENVSDSEEESATPIAKRIRSARDEETSSSSACERRIVRSNKQVNRERNDLIAKYVQLQCTICSEQMPTFSRLLLHYKRSHETQGQVTCCEKTFQKKSILYDHLRKVHESALGDAEDDESQLRCKLCDPVKNFKNEEGLQLHNVLCHSEEGERIYKCDQCEKAFDSEWALSGHQHWHRKIESLNIRCEKCNKYFNSVRTLNTHMRAFHPEDTTASSGTTTTSSTDSMTKVESTTPDQLIAGAPEDSCKSSEQQDLATFTAPCRKVPKSAEELAQEDDLIGQFCLLFCENCDFVGENFCALDRHYRKEHAQPGYAICCGRKFCKKRRLYEHCQWHVNPDAFRCETCNKSFSDSDGLEKHNKWVHTPDSEKPFKCEICDGAFYKDHQLQHHLKYHFSIEKKIFNCKDCDKAFGTAVALRVHRQNIHGAERNWNCDICGKGFVHRKQFAKHLLSHEEQGAASELDQFHTCSVCHQQFCSINALRRHNLAKHGDINVSYSCAQCKAVFKTKWSLSTHKSKYHRRRKNRTGSGHESTDGASVIP